MEQAFAALAQALNKQQEMLQALAEAQATQLAAQAAWQSNVVTPQPRAMPQEVRVEGLTMPKYSGRMDESISLYIHQVNTFFQAKNIDPSESAATQQRCLAIVAANLRGLAAAWYQERVQSTGTLPSTLMEFEEELRREFEPADLQERLRDQLSQLKQSHCKDLMEYIAKYRRICTQICEMTERDKIAWFNRGLRIRTREEVQYRRCGSVTEAIQTALEFERAHSFSLGLQGRNKNKDRRQENRFQAPRPQRQREPDDMEIDNANVRTSNNPDRKPSGACFNCGKTGHYIAQCRQPKPDKGRQGQPRRDNRRNDSRKPIRQNNARIEEIEDDEDEEIEVFETNTVRESSRASKGDANALMTKTGTLCGKSVRILVDSGATNIMCRPGLGKNVLREKEVSVEGFDGYMTKPTVVNEVCETLKFDGWTFKDLVMTEWDLGHKKIDVILGKPWFHQFNPQIDWIQHKVLSINAATLDKSTRSLTSESGWMMKVTTVQEAQHQIPDVVQDVLRKFKEVFPDKLPDALPPHRAVEFDLNMKSDAKPQHRPPFRLSQVEQASLDKFVVDLEKKGWITLSSSDWVSNIFGVPKRDEHGRMQSRREWLRTATPDTPIRWVLDYRHVNSQTEVPKIPLPNIEDLFDRMHGCCVFTKIDLASGYHQMLVVPTARKYTAFRTHREVYEWVVAPMGMAGMPGIWSRLMRRLFDKFPFVVVYMDDICVFSRNNEEHAVHLEAICEVLRDEKLYARPDKCAFGAVSVNFLGHTISKDGLHVDQQKIRAIEKWSEPTNRKELLSFLGLAGYYRKFIAGYAKLVLPLSDLVKASTLWKWDTTHRKAFLVIKLALQQAPVLQLPNYKNRFIVTTDASGYCCGAVLSQMDENYNDRPVAFLSKKLGPHELNWPAHEKELYAIKLALSKWRHFLHGSCFDVFTDNSACKWFMHTPVLTAKLTRWLDFFSRFDFVLHHRPGKLNVVADALSRPPPSKVQAHACTMHSCDDQCVSLGTIRDRYHAQVDAFESLTERDLAIIVNSPFSGEKSAKPSVTQRYVVNHSTQTSCIMVEMSKETKQRYREGYSRDPTYASGDTTVFVKKGELFFLRTRDQVWRLCVPSDELLRGEIIAQAHDSSTAAHPGIRRTQLSISQWYYWKTLDEDVKLYVATCETCSRYKTSSLKANGKMIPIEAPSQCWHTISIDWITGLPASKGQDAIMTVIDKLSKRAKYIATQTVADAPETAKLFFDHVVRHHGLPMVIISDRDPKFTSTFWRALMNLMGIKQSMTTAGRAQADGATERQNRTLEDSLRCQVSYLGEDWADHLATIEYAHQGLVQASTGLTPFEIDTGRRLRNPVVDALLSKNEFAKNFAEHRQEILKLAQENLKKAQARQKAYYDSKRSKVEFHLGDLVMLATRHIPLKHAQRVNRSERPKLVPRFIGPFEIVQVINPNAMRLKLPKSMQQLHDVFNVDRLKHYRQNPVQFAARPIPKVTPILLDEATGEESFIIEALLDKRRTPQGVDYLVKWHGYPPSEASWEPQANIKHVAHFKRLIGELQAMQDTAPMSRRLGENVTMPNSNRPIRERLDTVTRPRHSLRPRRPSKRAIGYNWIH
jgi:hypothetical protein